ncbi:MAG TPA: hypothetical protein VFE51_15530 [Verrucomicrobiae bacterium]|nr:hypothetical protein [Verrucomicrobiae bacterium]
MQRDIVFFVRGIPKDRLVQNPGVFFMAPIVQPLHSQIYEGAANIPILQKFFGKTIGVVAVDFRNDFEDERTAVYQAWRRLLGICDGLNLIVDAFQPDVCQVIKLREANAPGAKLMRYVAETWIHFHRDGSDSPKKWTASRDALFNRLCTFFDLVASGSPKYKTELGYQIAISAKMFRCGSESKSFGVEFLCKFSALEGLVCGPIQSEKHKILKERLGLLFHGSGSAVAADISRLWMLRCEASHQAKAFYDEDMPDSKVPQCEIVALERFFTGVLVFALDHLEDVQKISSLWSRVGSYTLPEYARMERPADMQKLAMLNFLEPTPWQWQDAGALIDATHEAVRANNE